MGTPHNRAEKHDFAKTVLMPGDPLRAKYIAETFLEDARLVNDVRGMLAYTGAYRGCPVSVMGSGMGMPSIGIYSYELYDQYGVENIIRVGSSGSYTDKVGLFDVVLATQSYSESSFAKMQSGYDSAVTEPSPALCEKLRQSAREQGKRLVEGPIHSSDVFYAQPGGVDFREIYDKHGCLCVEMESFALFNNARVLGKNAACLLTISDDLLSGKKATTQERQSGFSNMIEIALGAACL